MNDTEYNRHPIGAVSTRRGETCVGASFHFRINDHEQWIRQPATPLTSRLPFVVLKFTGDF